MDRERFTAVSKVQPISGESGTKSETSAARGPAVSLPKPSEEKWVLKTGHSLSFAGIFLFTALVYFRPYEYSPSLFWLSSSAFWVAIATLLVFLPTQLGLEGRITSRPREVNLVLLLLLAAALSIPLALNPARSWTALHRLPQSGGSHIRRHDKRCKIREALEDALDFGVACYLRADIDAINDYRVGRLAPNGRPDTEAGSAVCLITPTPSSSLVTMVPISVA